MMIEVRVTDPLKGSERVLSFTQSPVRVGRNQLNDVSLDDPFVSDWHGLIRFDESSVAYFDLGSTNGTMIGKTRVTKNVPVPLSEATRLSLGRIGLAVSRPAAGAVPSTRQTQAWGRPEKPKAPVEPAGPAGGLMADTPPAPGKRPAVPVSTPGSAPVVFPDTVGVATPPPPELRSSPGAYPATPPPGPAPSAGDPSRQLRMLEAFCEAFVGLKKGYEQFGTEVGVRIINGNTPLHKARTTQDVLSHLQNPSVDPGTAVQELISIFADFCIHHIAMMEGVTEGARALLQSLDPRANGLEGGPGIFTKSRNKGLWSAYLERFDQAVGDDSELHATVFGDSFARAYASVTLDGNGTGQGRNAGRNGR